jgi:hypothetical protein
MFVMRFLDRRSEMNRLAGLMDRDEAALALVWGRRRVGKTRLLLEWVRGAGGLYAVADQSAEAVQRRYLAEAVGAVLEGFAEVEYPDWRSLLRALARAAAQRKWRGPLIVDEFPYLVASSPSVASVMQAFLDHEARQAGLVVALSGSAQHMMQGLGLDRSSPLFGRATESLELQPLPAGYIGEALGLAGALEQIKAWASWGGIPRYWELAAPFGPSLEAAVDAVVLDPSGPLHREPDRLLAEELPPAIALRPILDAVGAGANRPSEIAGRVGAPVTSLARPLGRLQELGLLSREQPFGVTERGGKRSLYRIRDPFMRLWFSVVAPHRAALAVGNAASRRGLWLRSSERLCAEAWEEMCRTAVPRLQRGSLASLGPWGPAGRHWRGHDPELDVVAASIDGSSLLLGEVKWSATPFTDHDLDEIQAKLTAKGTPKESWAGGKRIVHVLFVPATRGPGRRRRPGGVHVVEGRDVLAALR